MRPVRPVALAGALAILAAVLPTLAGARASHAGWPKIGHLVINKSDSDRTIRGVRNEHNEILGGNGNDTIYGGDAGDVLWGDYKPSGQPTTQVDHIYAGNGDNFIYTSHGTNYVFTGTGRTVVHAHFGRGEIHCGSPRAIVLGSRGIRRQYKLFGCQRVMRG